MRNRFCLHSENFIRDIVAGIKLKRISQPLFKKFQMYNANVCSTKLKSIHVLINIVCEVIENVLGGVYKGLVSNLNLHEPRMLNH